MLDRLLGCHPLSLDLEAGRIEKIERRVDRARPPARFSLRVLVDVRTGLSLAVTLNLTVSPGFASAGSTDVVNSAFLRLEPWSAVRELRLGRIGERRGAGTSKSPARIARTIGRHAADCRPGWARCMIDGLEGKEVSRVNGSGSGSQEGSPRSNPRDRTGNQRDRSAVQEKIRSTTIRQPGTAGSASA